MKKAIIILLFALWNAFPLLAQRTWIETEVSKEVFKNLEFSIAPQLRFKEDFDLNEYFFDAGVEYEIHKYFQLGASYRFGYNINKKDEAESFGRFAFDAKTKYKWKNWEPKFRLRYTNEDDFSEEDEETIDYLRYKLELEYEIEKIKLTPYISYELYHELSENKISKARYESGLTYKLNKHNRIGLYYRYNDYLTKDKSVNIIGFSYKLKL